MHRRHRLARFPCPQLLHEKEAEKARLANERIRLNRLREEKRQLRAEQERGTQEPAPAGGVDETREIGDEEAAVLPPHPDGAGGLTAVADKNGKLPLHYAAIHGFVGASE